MIFEKVLLEEVVSNFLVWVLGLLIRMIVFFFCVSVERLNGELVVLKRRFLFFLLILFVRVS